MRIGIKIRKLRENKKMPQGELALQLGISQATLHNIESDTSHKIDFVLMGKICRIFDKDFSYFTNDTVENNNVKENKEQVNCENVTANNPCPESILIEIQNLINENKLLKTKIAELELYVHPFKIKNMEKPVSH
jgi:transcriptional regulator with XRE-family HTH domain